MPGKTTLPSWAKGSAPKTPSAAPKSGASNTTLPSWATKNPPAATKASAPAPTHHGGGIGGWLSSKADKAVHDVTGIPTGVAHLAKDVALDVVDAPKNIVTDALGHPAMSSSWKGTSGAPAPAPFARTTKDVKALGKQTVESYEHPLRDPFMTALNSAGLVTGGAGAAAKLGEAAGEAGLISKTSGLARLGEARDLTVPDFAKRVGQDGEDIVVKRSSSNPAVRARQTAVNKAMNKLPEKTPVVGSSARGLKALSKEPARAAARMMVDEQGFKNDFAKLTSSEKAAWHFKAQAVHPADYKTFLEKQSSPSPEMLKLLDNPKVAKAFDNPSPRLQAALSSGRELSDHLSAMRVHLGQITDHTAAESPYRLLRLVNGAETKALTGANAERLGGTDAALDSGHLGLVDKDGRDIPALAKELSDKGEEQPFYVPHSAEDRTGGSFRNKPPAGFAQPPVSGALKRSTLTLARKGMMNVHENTLLHEWTKQRGHVEAQQLHDALVEHAANLPKGQPLPKGYDYLKINRGESSAPYTEREAEGFESRLAPDKMFTKDEKDETIAESEDGQHRLVVPSEVKKILESRTARAPGKLYKLFYQQPSSLWKHLIVGLRPASAVNITVGNSVLGALQAAPRYGVTSWLNQIVKGERLGKVTDATMNGVFPEQKLGTFGRSVSDVTSGRVTKALHEKLPRASGAASKLYQGVMPATIKYENVLRRAMVEGWAKATPEVRDAMKQHGGDINAALKDVAKSHPHVINDISKRTDDALGDYHSYNGVERQIRQLVPFYGWDRHVVRSVGRIIGERPVKAAALADVGAQGSKEQEAKLGAMPSFLEDAIKLKGLPSWMGPMNGRKAILDPSSISPFSTATDLAQIPFGSHGASNALSDVNPFAQALLEQLAGVNLTTGDELPKKAVGKTLPEKFEKAFAETFGYVPQTSLVETALHGTQSKPNALYQNDWQTMLAALLGVKVKKLNLPLAQQEARKGR